MQSSTSTPKTVRSSPKQRRENILEGSISSASSMLPLLQSPSPKRSRVFVCPDSEDDFEMPRNKKMHVPSSNNSKKSSPLSANLSRNKKPSPNYSTPKKRTSQRKPGCKTLKNDTFGTHSAKQGSQKN